MRDYISNNITYYKSTIFFHFSFKKVVYVKNFS